MYKLREIAPRRYWVVGRNQLWYSIPWTKNAVADALKGGAKFRAGAHEFENREAARIAEKGYLEDLVDVEKLLESIQTGKKA